MTNDRTPPSEARRPGSPLTIRWGDRRLTRAAANRCKISSPREAVVLGVGVNPGLLLFIRSPFKAKRLANRLASGMRDDATRFGLVPAWAG